MKTGFRADRSSVAFRQRDDEGQQAESIGSQRWQLVSDLQEFLGDESEPDPQFFVESWTLGAHVAGKNLRVRLQIAADRERGSARLEEHGLPVQENEFFSSVRSEPTSSRFTIGWSSKPDEAASQTQQNATGEMHSFYEDWSRNRNTAEPMTLQFAQQVLGVTLISSKKQIKEAYREKARQWHPDRFAKSEKAARQFATEQMTAINEAYRVLRITRDPHNSAG